MNAMLPRGTLHTGEDGARPVATWLARPEMRRSTWGYEPANPGGRLYLGVLPEDGSVPNGVMVGYGDDRHIVTIAGSRRQIIVSPVAEPALLAGLSAGH